VIRQSLAVAKGNLSRAAELLSVTWPRLYDLLGKQSIDAAQFGRHAATAQVPARNESSQSPLTAPLVQASHAASPGLEPGWA
jgi:hypothetical protein